MYTISSIRVKIDYWEAKQFSNGICDLSNSEISQKTGFNSVYGLIATICGSSAGEPVVRSTDKLTYSYRITLSSSSYNGKLNLWTAFQYRR